MPKLKTVYVCSNCNYQSPRWSGQCQECKAWNSFVEDVIDANQEVFTVSDTKALDIISLGSEIIIKDRLLTGISEFDRVLGGGFVKDSLTLLTGNPGIGKSTLILQVLGSLAGQGLKVLYVSGEESVSQISLRAKRLFGDNLPKIDFINNTDIDGLIASTEKYNPDFVVLDSINVMSFKGIIAGAGSISQIKACTEVLMQYFKKRSSPLMLIGQVTKGGEMAGPQLLAHLVDVCLNFEGERYSNLRMLRGIKNRFGATSEIGVFEMGDKGLKEVSNPSEIFLEGRMANSEGSCITVTIEGTRPFLLEIQALTTFTNFTYPKRVTSGIDVSRLNIIIAVLQKHCGIKLDQMDVFVNSVGGFKVNEPALDLAICKAIISSKNKKPIDEKTVYFGEVGLSGEVRSVPCLEKRLKEVEKLGFERAYVPKMKKLPKVDLEIIQVASIKEIN